MSVEEFRDLQVATLPTENGTYALCDLDEVPIYVGVTEEGLRKRVQRHLTSARSDVIANRLLDVWEVAYVWAWPEPKKERMLQLEAHFYNKFHRQSSLVNVAVLRDPGDIGNIPQPVRVAVLPEDQILLRKRPEIRLPRQAKTFLDLVAHILEVKNNRETLFGLQTHFARLEKYTKQFLKPDLSAEPPSTKEVVGVKGTAPAD
ncbi:MAG TPA: GIY-YIG nuclease family protein [Bryobacteraceae bacterium]|nr:GIY-YIG nuclease family protein [Bryobacteraceae bacterium]